MRFPGGIRLTLSAGRPRARWQPPLARAAHAPARRPHTPIPPLACMHGQMKVATMLAARASDSAGTLPTLEMSPEEGSRKLAADQRAASARLEMLAKPSGPLLKVYRERAIWSVQQCEELLAAVTAAVDARGGEWETKRHTAYATTDLPANQLLLPAYRALCQQLHAGLLPLLGEQVVPTPLRVQ